MKRCAACGKTKELSEFGKHKSTKSGIRCWCKECNRSKSRASYNSEAASKKWWEVKQDFVDAYGGKCYCCGEDNIEFLSLDHIVPMGSRERREEGTGMQSYLRLKRLGYPKDKYRVACMNCNTAVKYGRVCPHQRSKRNVPSRSCDS